MMAPKQIKIIATTIKTYNVTTGDKDDYALADKIGMHVLHQLRDGNEVSFKVEE